MLNKNNKNEDLEQFAAKSFFLQKIPDDILIFIKSN